MNEKLILALDVDPEQAQTKARALKDTVEIIKIGGRLFTALGPDIVHFVQKQKRNVFLDLKFHDIPLTVAESCRNATRLGVWGLTIHTCGGSNMMKQAAQAVAQEAKKLKIVKPLIFGVTVLTSMSDADLKEVGLRSKALAQVQRLALLAQQSGLDGVVASPCEIAAVRKVCGKKFLVMTPGIRSAQEAGKDDQSRTLTAAQAVQRGADYLVVGRPILKALNPKQAAQVLAKEIEAALQV